MVGASDSRDVGAPTFTEDRKKGVSMGMLNKEQKVQQLEHIQKYGTFIRDRFATNEAYIRFKGSLLSRKLIRMMGGWPVIRMAGEKFIAGHRAKEFDGESQSSLF